MPNRVILWHTIWCELALLQQFRAAEPWHYSLCQVIMKFMRLTSWLGEYLRMHVSKHPPCLAGGMNGFLLPAVGEPCPAVVPAPFSLGDDIAANSVCCACFRNPPHQRHLPRLLEGQAPEARPCF